MGRIRLHDYMYLDVDLVDRLISQVDGGLTHEEDQTRIDRSAKGASLGLAVSPLGAQGAIGKGSQSETARTVRQTPDSTCSRLIKALELEGLLQYLDAFDQAIWDQLEAGEVLELQTTIEIPMFARLGELAARFSPLLGLMQAAGQEIDTEATRAVSGIEAFSDMFNRIPVIAQTVGSKHRFIATLKSSAIRVGLSELYGEARLLGTLQRKLRRGETWSIVDAIGFAGVPRHSRRQMERSLANSKELDVQLIRPPAAILNPIAIYR